LFLFPKRVFYFPILPKERIMSKKVLLRVTGNTRLQGAEFLAL